MFVFMSDKIFLMATPLGFRGVPHPKWRNGDRDQKKINPPPPPPLFKKKKKIGNQGLNG